jgi:hypothetical protein
MMATSAVRASFGRRDSSNVVIRSGPERTRLVSDSVAGSIGLCHLCRPGIRDTETADAAPPTGLQPRGSAGTAPARRLVHGLPFSAWGLSKLVELLVAEGELFRVRVDGLGEPDRAGARAGASRPGTAAHGGRHHRRAARRSSWVPRLFRQPPRPKQAARPQPTAGAARAACMTRQAARSASAIRCSLP